MKTTFCLLLSGYLSLASVALGQVAIAPAAPQSSPSGISNPFDESPMGGGMGGMGGGMGAMGGGMGAMGDGMGAMGDGMDMGMEMGVDTWASDDVFRFRLKNAIKRIGASKTEQERTTLMQFTEKGLEDHYDEMIARRKKDLERLKKSLSQLETDLTRREAAKDRVVKLQMQSAILASEGLLDLKSLQPEGDGMESSGYGGMGMGMGMGMGPGN